jgi:hypothetical protein
LHEFDPGDQAAAADVAHERVPTQPLQRTEEDGLERGDASDDLLPLDRGDDRAANSARDGIAGHREVVLIAPRPGTQHVHHAVVDHHRRERRVTGREALGQQHEIRLGRPVLDPEPPARPPDPADDLVAHEQDVVAVARRRPPRCRAPRPR